MTAKTKLILTGLLTAALSAHAATIVEPPVVDDITEIPRVRNQFSFNAQTELHSDLIWRGQSLTNQNPGFISANQASWRRGRITSQVEINLFSNASDLGVSDAGIVFNSSTNDSVASPAGTSAQTHYLMTESKVGSKIKLGHKHKETASIGINRVIYKWPRGNNWLWTGSECDDSDENLLSSYERIKSFKSIELTFDWNQYHLLYSIVDHASQPTTEQTLATSGDYYSDPDPYSVAYGKNWNDYLYIKTPVNKLNKDYTYHFEFGYWKETGRFYSGNLFYQFTETTIGKLKIFNFDGFDGNDSKTGASAALAFNYHSALKKRPV